MLIFFWIRPKTDRTLFRELIKTNGVGPKLALAILSAMSVETVLTLLSEKNCQN